MLGKRLLPVKAGNIATIQEFWLADIQDPCIIRLDLLTRWGALVNVSRNAIHLPAP